MKTVLFLFLFLILQLNARENPFAPVEKFGGEPLNKPLPVPDFEKKIIPVVEKEAKCTVPERNTTTIITPEKVWKENKPSKKIKKPILFTHKKKSVKKFHKKQKISKSKKIHIKPKFHLLYHDANLKIYNKGKSLKIITNDTLIDHFKLKSPNRLVLDFGDDFVIYDTITKKLHTPYLKTLKIGTHDTFYRLTFTLKKGYRYRLKKLSDGYLITLR
jgi:hypothetical protein